jgi:hypothetical protein
VLCTSVHADQDCDCPATDPDCGCESSSSDYDDSEEKKSDSLNSCLTLLELLVFIRNHSPIAIDIGIFVGTGAAVLPVLLVIVRARRAYVLSRHKVAASDFTELSSANQTNPQGLRLYFCIAMIQDKYSYSATQASSHFCAVARLWRGRAR